MKRSNTWAALATFAALGLSTIPAGAATWVATRTTPWLGEIIAVDATGETGWPFGYEDVAGDGTAFTTAEQQIDVRTAYATTDTSRFWFRMYVVDPNAVGVDVDAYLFIDADHDTTTGGSAAATDLSAQFTNDPTPGGYDYVFAVLAHGTITKAFSWDDVQKAFVEVTLAPNDAAAETGEDVDPLSFFGNGHGYLQGSINQSIVGITPACSANLFLRTASHSGTGHADLNIDTVRPCIPVATSGGVAQIVVPIAGCTSDSQCPAHGICVSNACVVPPACLVDADCAANEHCNANGVCVVQASGSCTTTADCGDRVCVSGTCTACTLGGTECGSNRVCSPSGLCVTGTWTGGGGSGGQSGGLTLAPGEEVRGGPCACSTPGSQKTLSFSGLALLATSIVATLRSRRGRRRNETEVSR